MSHKHSLFKIATSEVASFEKNFFCRSLPLVAEISASQKAECLLAIGEDQKISDLLLQSTIEYDLQLV